MLKKKKEKKGQEFRLQVRHESRGSALEKVAIHLPEKSRIWFNLRTD